MRFAVDGYGYIAVAHLEKIALFHADGFARSLVL
jgi:hypothetical protein